MNLQPYRQSMLKKFKLDLDIVRSKGCYHYDAQGKKILDGVAQYGALPFGHNSSELNAIAIDYLQRECPNFIQPFVAASTQQLADRLIQVAGANYEQVVFTNTGTETVEAALKLSRLKTGRRAVLSAKNSFHGKTYAALSATGSKRYSNPDIVDGENYSKVQYNDLAALQAALETRRFSAFIVEPIQGEGGMTPAETNYLVEAQRLCRVYGTLLVLDEIQTGLGRSGAVFAAHRFGVEPDLILLSKALGGGIIPIGAMIIKRGVYSAEFDSKHSSTFANGGLACAVGLAVINSLMCEQSALLEHVRECEAIISQRLALLADKYTSFTYSGLGLMYALHFSDPATQGNYIVSYAQKSDLMSLLICGYLVHVKGIFCMPLLNDAERGSIRFQPALTISKSELKRFLGAFEEVCEILQNKRYDKLMGFLVGYVPAASDAPVKGNAKKKPRPRPLSPQPVKGDHVQFAFLLHSTSAEDICRGLPEAVIEYFTEAQKLALAHWFFSFGQIENSPEVVFEFSMASPHGRVVNGAMIYSPISPQAMLKLSRADKADLLKKYLQKAQDVGAVVVGLGAYTSVISKGGLDIADAPFRLTTGNSLTAISSCNLIREVFGPSALRKRLMIFGARGSVGRVALMDLCQFFGKIDIVGSMSSTVEEQYINLRGALIEVLLRVECLSDESAAGKFWGVCRNLDLEQALLHCPAEQVPVLMQSIMDAGTASGVQFFEVHIGLEHTVIAQDIDCVYSATSEGKPFIAADVFPKTCKIFDVARPFDVLREGGAREVYEGGLVTLPDAQAMLSDCNIIGCEPGVSLACLSETILLSMENVSSSYSIGKEIAYDEAKEVGELAARHGFSHYIDRKKDRLPA
ncbi:MULTISPECIES: aminotransferase class III-fold pyridoxal phosphate-dependent enzyme [unclassified Pseudomonas]|uniref:aminotransferase class III-fold pyridoxal phosphate-dependent enzyme n=1 Tax=unclassified Pseudomonas TaxID=196821 RepID=UPI00081C1ABE|nr:MULTISPECIES: aminotransferase class III-fold pyridoxal phosphate-dependent enzyme [unclassified Pseudomonas]TKJ73224.1 aspartate aminotransferase family protein [Pseudomonas sp. CFBP13509]